MEDRCDTGRTGVTMGGHQETRRQFVLIEALLRQAFQGKVNFYYSHHIPGFVIYVDSIMLLTIESAQSRRNSPCENLDEIVWPIRD